jgi:hypothetical protein
MKNLYTKNEFLNLQKDEKLNEGFLGSIFKGLWKGVVKIAKNIKGSDEINKVYDKYKGEIDSAFAKMANIGAAETTAAVTAPAKPTTPAGPAAAPAKTAGAAAAPTTATAPTAATPTA